MNKILISIQGRTLILYYQVMQNLKCITANHATYIQVLPSDELVKFDLKGLTPEMFCVNIADMVNIRGMHTGQVENEKQQPVAKWEMNYEAYLLMRNAPHNNLTHHQIARLLEPMPHYIQETENQYIDFEERVTPKEDGNHGDFFGYRLTIVTEEIEGDISSYAYYSLDTCTQEEWLNISPQKNKIEEIKAALDQKLDLIKNTGVCLERIIDQTDYAILPE